ncbi:LD-carboxypeptidase [Gracilimonas sp.]|uniref:S66 peptidase family protein n=1 Tax=Gracilimonas sp. TaxID=1974203 RepID=UPI00287208A2|nr:LD-carboxypeptidase [Gracilimonas sp.]
MDFSRKDFIKKTTFASLTGLVFAKENKFSKLSKPYSNKIKPNALKSGDTLGLVAPGSPIYEKSVFDKMLADLENLGFNLKLGEFVREQRGYLAGTDHQRAEDLHNMFQDPEVDGIMCIRGGWGCNRILPLLDFEIIHENPKVFCGFSDITSLHMAFYEKSDLLIFHGPVGKSTWNSFTKKAFRSVLENGETPSFEIPNGQGDGFIISSGKTEGILLGGNLSVLVSMIGSDYLPSFEGAILFLEDVGESVYRVDRMLTQLKLAGILDEISGFVFGKCTDCNAGNNSLSLKEVFDDHIKPLNIPAFYGAMISHEDNNITLPVGQKAIIDATRKVIKMTQPAVTEA